MPPICLQLWFRMQLSPVLVCALVSCLLLLGGVAASPLPQYGGRRGYYRGYRGGSRGNNLAR